MSGTVLIMAGGTGGHVFPALALARLLRAASHQVIWLGTQRGLEARVVPADGFPIEWLSVGGLRGKGLATLRRRRSRCCARSGRRWRSCAAIDRRSSSASADSSPVPAGSPPGCVAGHW